MKNLIILSLTLLLTTTTTAATEFGSMSLLSNDDCITVQGAIGKKGHGVGGVGIQTRVNNSKGTQCDLKSKLAVDATFDVQLQNSIQLNSFIGLETNTAFNSDAYLVSGIGIGKILNKDTIISLTAQSTKNQKRDYEVLYGVNILFAF